jgi:xylulokinase
MTVTHCHYLGCHCEQSNLNDLHTTLEVFLLMRRDILAIDVGTSAFKIGVFGPDLQKRCEASREYRCNLYDHGKADIETEKWWQALKDCCVETKEFLTKVGTISFSVTTPGLVAMGENGNALGPAILMLDGRSHKQAREIRQWVGEEKFLQETCNLPVSGGSSLCSILWIKENQPEIWKATTKFGHCNTYMVKRFTGDWAIDPSTTSITGLYNTVRHDLTWNKSVLSIAGIPENKLPPLVQSYHRVGNILPEIANELGLPQDCDVLCGGNDAVLAALSGGFTAPGDINYICGTCEITNVCLEQPIHSRNFNVRCHVIPNRWVTFFVLNTGGLALEWFHSVFCREMTQNQFYNDYVPSVLDSFLRREKSGPLEAEIPGWTPFLQGSRYSLEQLKASLSGLTLETTREDILLGLIKGNSMYQEQNIKEVSALVKLGRKVMTTGGGSKIRNFLKAKQHWMGGNFEFEYQDQSSLLGAAMLGQFNQMGRYL